MMGSAATDHDGPATLYQPPDTTRLTGEDGAHLGYGWYVRPQGRWGPKAAIVEPDQGLGQLIPHAARLPDRHRLAGAYRPGTGADVRFVHTDAGTRTEIWRFTFAASERLAQTPGWWLVATGSSRAVVGFGYRGETRQWGGERVYYLRNAIPQGYVSSQDLQESGGWNAVAYTRPRWSAPVSITVLEVDDQLRWTFPVEGGSADPAPLGVGPRVDRIQRDVPGGPNPAVDALAIHRDLDTAAWHPEGGFVVAGTNLWLTGSRPDGALTAHDPVEVVTTWAPTGRALYLHGVEAHRWWNNVYYDGHDSGTEDGAPWLPGPPAFGVPEPDGDHTAVPGNAGNWVEARTPVYTCTFDWVRPVAGGFLARVTETTRRIAAMAEDRFPYRRTQDVVSVTAVNLVRSGDGTDWTPVWRGGVRADDPGPEATVRPSLYRLDYEPAEDQYGEPRVDRYEAVQFLEKGGYTDGVPASEAVVSDLDHTAEALWDNAGDSSNDRMAARPFLGGMHIRAAWPRHPETGGERVRWYRVERTFWPELEPWWWIDDAYGKSRALVPPEPGMATDQLPAGAVIRYVETWRDEVWNDTKGVYEDYLKTGTSWYRVLYSFTRLPGRRLMDHQAHLQDIGALFGPAAKPYRDCKKADVDSGACWPESLPWFWHETPEGVAWRPPCAAQPGFVPASAPIRRLAVDDAGRRTLRYYRADARFDPGAVALTAFPVSQVTDYHAWGQSYPSAPVRGLDVEQYVARGWLVPVSEAEATAEYDLVVTHSVGSLGDDGGDAPAPPVQLPDGRLLCAVPPDGDGLPDRYLLSDDDGKSWTERACRPAAPPDGVTLTGLRDDRIFVVTAPGRLLAVVAMGAFDTATGGPADYTDLYSIDPDTNTWHRLWRHDGIRYERPVNTVPGRAEPGPP